MPHRKRAGILIAVLVLGIASAAAVLNAALNAMGGIGTLQSISGIEYHAVGYRQMVEQSEHPQGPYFMDSLEIHEVRDVKGRRVRIEQRDGAYGGPNWWLTQTQPYETTVVVDNGSPAVETKSGLQPGGSSFVDMDRDERLYQPELLLLNALHDPKAHLDGVVTLHGVPHDVLRYTAGGVDCTLYLNRQTHLPWELRFTRAYPYSTFASAWGDVPTTVTYNGWSLEPDGIVFPREWTITKLGLPDTQLTITSLTVNPKYDSSSLTIPRAFAKAHPAMPADRIPLGSRGTGAPHRIAPEVTTIPGAWNISFIRQSDGLVMLEAPWSPNYTKQALEYARRNLHARVKAVVTTSDSWPHISGLREAVAQHVPIYALDLNVPIIERLLQAPHRQRPDDLQQHPARAIIHAITRDTVLGTGTNRLVLIPYRQVTAERQMMVYIPSQELLYTSDLFSHNTATDWFTPEYLREAVCTIAREHLRVRTVFGMHYDATPYSAITGALKPTNYRC